MMSFNEVAKSAVSYFQTAIEGVRAVFSVTSTPVPAPTMRKAPFNMEKYNLENELRHFRLHYTHDNARADARELALQHMDKDPADRYHKNYALHKAIISGDTILVAQAIEKRTLEQLNEGMDSSGTTPLILAAMTGNRDIVDQIIDAGIDIEKKRTDGHDVLDVVESDPELHAHILKRLNARHEIKMSLEQNREGSGHCAALMQAIEHNEVKLAEEAIKLHDRSNRRDALSLSRAAQMAATSPGRKDILGKLFGAGADINLAKDQSNFAGSLNKDKPEIQTFDL